MDLVGFELLDCEVSDFDWPTAMLDLEDPICWNGLNGVVRFHFASKSTIFVVALFFSCS